MSEPKTPSGEDKPKINLTARDLEMLGAAMQSLKDGPLIIDYAKFAEKGGFKNANSAKASWHGLKKKLDKAAGDDETPTTPTDGTSKGTQKAGTSTGKKRKAAASAAGDRDGDGDGDGVEATPTKGKGKRGRKAKAEVGIEYEDGSEEGELVEKVVVKGKGGKRAVKAKPKPKVKDEEVEEHDAEQEGAAGGEGADGEVEMEDVDAAIEDNAVEVEGEKADEEMES